MNIPRYLNDGDAWIIAEEIPDIDFQFSQLWLSSFVNNIDATIGDSYKKVLCVYDGYNLIFYFGDKDSERVSNTILRKIVDEDFGPTINANIKRGADALSALAVKITPEYVASLSNDQLSDFYEELDRVHTEAYGWFWLTNAVDMFHTHLTNYLKDLLRLRLHSDEEANAALVALSFSEDKSYAQQELDSLLEIALYKKKHPENADNYELMLKKHHDDFFYLKHLWIGKDGVSTLDEYRDAVEKILSEHDPKSMLIAEEEKRHADTDARDTYEKKANLSDAEKRLFRAYAEFAFTKAYRRRVQLYWAYKMDFIFAELSQRLGISFMESRFLVPEEVYDGLKNGFTDTFKEIVSERTKHCVYYGERDVEIVAVGQDCKKYEEMIVQETNHDVGEFKGQVAYVGKVTGRVKIVNTISEMYKVEPGDILVSIATNPDILPAMKRAIAFVTEQGGITSHAAIVSREMKKPCIVGTKIATKALHDGDLIEVDAEKGVVSILEKA